MRTAGAAGDCKRTHLQSLCLPRTCACAPVQDAAPPEDVRARLPPRGEGDGAGTGAPGAGQRVQAALAPPSPAKPHSSLCTQRPWVRTCPCTRSCHHGPTSLLKTSISQGLWILSPCKLQVPRTPCREPSRSILCSGHGLPRPREAMARGGSHAYGDTMDNNHTENTTASCFPERQTLLPLALRLLLFLINWIICFLLQLFCHLRLQINSVDGENPKLLLGQTVKSISLFQ